MANATAVATPIERTPNIGATLAVELRGVGIDSLEALMRVGFWDAWLQLRRVKPERDGVPACLALAGAPWAAGGSSARPRPRPRGPGRRERRRVPASRGAAAATHPRSRNATFEQIGRAHV